MTDTVRAKVLWQLILDHRPEPSPGSATAVAVDALIRGGRAVRDGGRVRLTQHPRASRWTDEAETEIVAATRLILLTLETIGGPIRSCRRLGAGYGLAGEHVDEARQRLIADGLLRITDDNTTVAAVAVAPTPGLTPEVLGLTRVRRPAPSPKGATGELPTPSEPTPAPVPAEQAEPEQAPTQPAAPEPLPKPEVSRPPTRAARPKSTPKPATPKLTPEPATPVTLATELLSRIAHAAEVQARLTIAGASRVRTPLGVSPLLDCQRRIAVVLAAADGPMTAGQLGTGHLTRSQRLYRDAALVDGVAIGAFARAGGVFGRAVRYTLRDPEPLSSSWDEVHAAAGALRRRREAG